MVLFGRAVEQNRSGTNTQIVYGPSGAKFAFMNGSTLIEYIDPMVAGMAAIHNGNGTGHFQHADWLGSSRFAQDGGGNVIYDRAYAPFGEPYDEYNNVTTNRNFTAQTEDTTPGLYDFLFRQESSSQSRWLVPDPAGLAAVDITNPQTWNRYAYLANNPLNAVDPKGLYLCETDAETGQTMCDGNGAPGGGGGGGGGDDCDAECMLQQAKQNAGVALSNDNSNCASVVDGGTGIAAATIAGQGFGTIGIGGNMPAGTAGETLVGNQVSGTAPNGAPSISYNSTILMNSSPYGYFLNPDVQNFIGTAMAGSGTYTGYSVSAFQTIEVLHELAHGAANSGNPGSTNGQPGGFAPDSPENVEQSMQNTNVIANNCFPQGDFSGTNGPLDPPPVDAHAIRPRVKIPRRRR